MWYIVPACERVGFKNEGNTEEENNGYVVFKLNIQIAGTL